MNTSKVLQGVTALTAVAVLAGCASTSFKSTWKAPDVQKLTPTGKKVAAVCVIEEESRRRACEEALSEEFRKTGADVAPSYALLQPAERRPHCRQPPGQALHLGERHVGIQTVGGQPQRCLTLPLRGGKVFQPPVRSSDLQMHISR